jgi:hypothetical protein
MRLAVLFLCLAALAPAQKRILYLTHSAGFRHDSIGPSIVAMEGVAQRTGRLSVTATEDLSIISADRLRDFDAIFFFTSGELPLSDRQKQDLLAFVRSGKGFGGAHSATDTLYTWAEYGEMIGGYFDGHPWAQEAAIDVEDPDFPGMRAVTPSFRIVEELYQFRAFSRDRVRVLMTLDTATVNLNDPGVNRTDGDFALAWVRRYGEGRVFYTALGHFDETWADPRFQNMLEGALLWLAGEVEADAAPRSTGGDRAPSIAGVASPTAAAETFAPGSVIAIYGSNLSNGSTLVSPVTPLPGKLAGTRVEVNGRPAPLFFVSPAQVNAQLPFDLTPGEAALRLTAVNRSSEPVSLRIAEAAPVLVAAARGADFVALYATGLGRVDGAVAGQPGPSPNLRRLAVTPEVEINGRSAEVSFAGMAPVLVGVYQINAAAPGSGVLNVRLRMPGAESNLLRLD